ncbi:MAG: protein adenylyltransferase SelO family protein [Halopseudomonas sp.]
MGDGRAMLIGELVDSSGQRQEVQLKGSGPTPYSRGFDGRAVLRSVIREYLASEAMAALSIPTTRALCIINSGTPVAREQTESAAMMIRTAPSHLRFGSFEHFYARGQLEQLQQLADFCIEHYFADLPPQSYSDWFAEVVRRTARLMAQWQAAGFCHGVMNTDNFSILGLTLDYGPYGFLDHYDPAHICNHSDGEGRYSFERQPGIGFWNCRCLAHALTPLISKEDLDSALAQYEPELQRTYLTQMRLKLGLTSNQLSAKNDQADEALIAQLLALLEAQQLDYSRFFRGLGYWLIDNDNTDWLYQQAEPGTVDA